MNGALRICDIKEESKKENASSNCTFNWLQRRYPKCFNDFFILFYLFIFVPFILNISVNIRKIVAQDFPCNFSQFY